MLPIDGHLQVAVVAPAPGYARLDLVKLLIVIRDFSHLERERERVLGQLSSREKRGK